LDHDQPLRLGIGQGAKQNRVDDAEDGGVDADPQPERENHHRAEARVFDEHPDRQTEILDEALVPLLHGFFRTFDLRIGAPALNYQQEA
jgi:hypothetical protein